MGKKYVLDGAMLQCDQGMKPAKLLVTQNKKVKIQGKFQATDKETQVPETFGQCKLKPSGSSYLPCVPALQPWTKTAKKSTLGGSKKFLFEDSECMCATGGKVTVMQHAQINSAGSVKETFKNIAMMIPGAMMGNDKAPKVVESYWMDEAGKERIDSLDYGEKAQLFVLTENMDAGETLTVNVKDKEKQDFNKGEKQLTYSGSVKADGTAAMKQVTIDENWIETEKEK